MLFNLVLVLFLSIMREYLKREFMGGRERLFIIFFEEEGKKSG